jgi:hypothetical protein
MYHLLTERVSRVTSEFLQYRARVWIGLNRAGCRMDWFIYIPTMDTRLKEREGFMALKLDMSKAYDRLEWDFLEAMLWKLGFAPRWIYLLMTCVHTVTYSILINGQPYGRIVPTRGI